MPKTKGRKLRSVIAFAAVFLFSASIALLYPLPSHGSLTPSTVFVTPPDIIDQPGIDIRTAHLNPFLVQWGTSSPYTGQGPPGINLAVETNGTVLDWTITGWANMTSQPTLRTCAQDGVTFDRYDWVFENNGGSSGSQGAFVTRPTTVPQRMGVDGDQCLLRIFATGTWHVVVCVNLDGLPKGIYDAPDGHRHRDDWDRCVEKDVQVA